MEINKYIISNQRNKVNRAGKQALKETEKNFKIKDMTEQNRLLQALIMHTGRCHSRDYVVAYST